MRNWGGRDDVQLRIDSHQFFDASHGKTEWASIAIAALAFPTAIINEIIRYYSIVQGAKSFINIARAAVPTYRRSGPASLTFAVDDSLVRHDAELRLLPLLVLASSVRNPYFLYAELHGEQTRSCHEGISDVQGAELSFEVRANRVQQRQPCSTIQKQVWRVGGGCVGRLRDRHENDVWLIVQGSGLAYAGFKCGW